MRKFKIKIACKVVYGFKPSISHFCTMPKWMHTLDEFIHANQLLKPGDNLLLAVSGGMDSMLLLHFLHLKEYAFEVAHCNFGLRGLESDADEALVEKYCHEHLIPFHLKKFDTANYAALHGVSIQMAARDLRYSWFNELNTFRFEGRAKILTAHHKSDHAETILLNLVKGTGLKGLEGIAPISDHKIRPLLCFSKNEIELAVAESNINYREDQSNASDAYQRNRLRLNVIPELKKINPDLENMLLANSQIVKQANTFIASYMKMIESETVLESNNQVHISLEALRTKPEPKFILYTFLAKFGFNAAVVDNIFKAMDGNSGKQFYSKTHGLFLDRRRLIIEKTNKTNLQTFEIHENTAKLQTAHHDWIFKSIPKDWTLPNSSHEALIDYTLLKFPLQLRPWQRGDKIRPLGMSGHKKVSDILIDKKISIVDKAKVWVLISGDEIAWISGLMLSEDFKISDKTTFVLSVILKSI